MDERDPVVAAAAAWTRSPIQLDGRVVGWLIIEPWLASQVSVGDIERLFAQSLDLQRS